MKPEETKILADFTCGRRNNAKGRRNPSTAARSMNGSGLKCEKLRKSFPRRRGSER